MKLLRAVSLSALAAGAFAAPASAVQVTLGPATLAAGSSAFYCDGGTPGTCPDGQTMINSTLAPGDVLTAPMDGTIVGWRVLAYRLGAATVKLQTVRQTAAGYVATATGDNAPAVDGTLNPVSIPIEAGDGLGVRQDSPGGAGSSSGIRIQPGAGLAIRQFKPALGSLPAAGTGYMDYNLGFNAVVELAPPAPASITPSTGGIAGGELVTIKGDHLDPSPVVKFGTTEAVVKSATNTEITALAPPGVAGPSSVTVTTAAGTSAGLTYTRVDPNAPPPVVPDTTAPVVRSLGLSPKSFKASKGTKISVDVGEASTLTFRVHRVLSGKRSGKRCVARTKKNAKAKTCKRYVAVKGSFTKKATAAGKTSLTFKGRVGGRTLKAGSYRLTVTARDAAGNTSKARTATFTIRKK